jgi:superfamily I DNA/RNA helicase
MNYIFITVDAIMEIASNRKFQSSEFIESIELCQVLKGELDDWSYGKILLKKTTKGGYLYTTNPIIKKGLFFDFSTFTGFVNNSNENIITIFQKIAKYAIRYFDGLPLIQCERHIPDSSLTIIFPFPFSRTRDVYKVMIERNPGKYERKEKDFLLVYAVSTSDNKIKPELTNLKKAVEESNTICRPDIGSVLQSKTAEKLLTLEVSEFDKVSSLEINSSIGYDNWKHYLTENQKKFIVSEVNGPERLEGAAGTGKTLAMILRCITLLKTKKEQSQVYSIAFITHSISTKNQIIDTFKANYEDVDYFLDKEHSNINLTVLTLQEWCIKFLGAYISETEYLDRDAQDSKMLQIMYLEEALNSAIQKDLATYKIFCSRKFIDFIETTPKDNLLEMLQHEVAVTIKGRANDNIEKYKSLPRLKYSIPCENEGDLNFLFLVFQYYQTALQATGQFDSDDIILTSLGQLNTPIWRRRRNKEGFDACFVDETHLFNLNELSIFHYLNKEGSKQNIVFTIDKSQAVGDRGLVDDVLFEALGFNSSDLQDSHKLNTIFRSSPEIINVAFSVLSSGVTLFTNFENPLDKAIYNFTESEEKKCISPVYKLIDNEDEMISSAFCEAESLCKTLGTQRSKILLIFTSELLSTKIYRYASSINKPFELLKSRGDLSAIKSAQISNRFVVAGIDYVGGLEFDGVIIIGVDKGRVPPNNSENYMESYHFLNYAWHNRMYVAITRAKYALILLGEKTRGISLMFENAINDKFLKLE